MVGLRSTWSTSKSFPGAIAVVDQPAEFDSSATNDWDAEMTNKQIRRYIMLLGTSGGSRNC